MNKNFIAAFGNRGILNSKMGYKESALRDFNQCINIDKNNPKTRCKCIIKNCNELKKNNWKFCSDKCEIYPCQRLKSLDKRYKTKYEMSMIENLKYIEKNGISKFTENEVERWKCPKCGGVICVHNRKCYNCGI